MDIKVLKNFEVSRAELVNKNLVLAISDDISNEEKRLGGSYPQSLFLINPDTNEKADICPELDKYMTEDVIYALSERDYVVFPTLHDDDSQTVITWYMFKCYEGTLKQLHSMSLDVERLNKTMFIKAFVLDEFHIFIQKENVSGEEHTFSYLMYNAQSGTVSEVTIPRLTESGIECVQPISDGICALKVGRSFSSDKPFAYKTPEHPGEFIGTVTVNKFISELSINMDNRFAEIIEESNDLTTLPYMKVSGTLIIYAIYYPSEEKEDIIIYDTKTGKKTVRINSRLNSINDMWHTFVIDGNPYLVSGSDGGSARITDLNTQKVIAKINRGDDIPAVCGNYAVLTRKKKRMMREIDHVEVYEFSKLLKEPVFSVKAILQHCIVHEDTLILFINDSRTEDE